MLPNRLAALALCLVFSLKIFAQNILDVGRVSSKIELDGRVDEPGWQSATPIAYTQQQPNFGQPPTERSEIFLGYDDEYLYFAGRIHLSDSTLFRGTTFKRDAFDPTTDYFGILLDSYNDHENAVCFFTTPVGMRWDGTVANDCQSDSDISSDWNSFWDAAAVRTPGGWQAEIRVPWSSLRFQVVDNETIMGVTSWWYIAAKNEQEIFPAISLDYGFVGQWKASLAQRIRFRGLRSKSPIYVAPYLLAGKQESQNLNETGTAYTPTTEQRLEPGVDLKLNLTSNMTLDLTANTDFAQVEADEQQTNLTRFDLFFPEKRLFFQERASVFDFGFEDDNRVFYSRRIGINDDGKQVRLFGGARLVGRVGKTDLGVLTMQSAAPEQGLFSENFAVVRGRRQVFNPFSTVGIIATNRMDGHGRYNSVAGVDGNFRVTDDEYLTVKLAQSVENQGESKFGSLGSLRSFVRWERRRYEGFSYRAMVSRAEGAWSPGAGFEYRPNFTLVNPLVRYGFIASPKSALLRHQFYAYDWVVTNNTDHRAETINWGGGVEMEFKNGWYLEPKFEYSYERLAEGFALTDAVGVPAGEYRFGQFIGKFNSPGNFLFSNETTLTVGGYYDGTLVSANFKPKLKLSAHWDLEGFYEINRVNFPQRGQSFTAQLARLRAAYFLNTKFSVSALLQFNNQDALWLANVRLRYNPREGNDLYLVFNDVLNDRRERLVPRLPLHDSRAVAVKYTYTFRI